MKLPFDKIDVTLLCGLFILGAGLWLYKGLDLALSVVGGVVTTLALFSALKG